VNDGPGATYHERLGVPLRWWAQGTMAVAILWLTVVVSVPGPTAWIVTGVALVGLAACLFWYGDARVVVEDGWFHAGRARIEAKYVGDVSSLDADCCSGPTSSGPCRCRSSTRRTRRRTGWSAPATPTPSRAPLRRSPGIGDHGGR
jgi:hypothetical protein